MRLGLAVFLLDAAAAAQPSLEYQVKAAFLLNFTKFVEWPATAFPDDRSPLTICILGEDPFRTVLDQIVEGETVNGRKVAVQRIKRSPPQKACQVLFAAGSTKDVARLMSGSGTGILTVGEGEGFIREGGMIAFVLENRRVRFAINQAVTEGAGLKISSKLLSVAKTVEKSVEK